MSTEDSTRTAAEPATPTALASRDAEPEITENYELEQPEPTPDQRDLEDIIAQDEDPRSAIYAKAAKKREEAIEQGNDYMTESGVENPESQDIIESEGNEAQTVTPPDIVEDKVAIVINGERRMVDKNKVDMAGGIENYQIRIAAQEQMERNAHERKELDQRQAALDERERRLAASEAEIPATDSHQGQPNPEPDLPVSDGQNLNDMAKQVLDAVYDGDENAPSNLVGMINTIVKQSVGANQQAQKPVSTAELTQQVTEQVLREQRYAKVVTARERLFNSTPQLNKQDPNFDQRLFQAVDDETDVVAREHPEWEPEQVINKAWERVSAWKGEHKTDTMQDKQEAKREINRPRQAGGRYQPPPPPPRQTDSDYVKSLRQERGLES